LKLARRPWWPTPISHRSSQVQFHLECMTQQRQMTEPLDPSQFRLDVQQRANRPALALGGILLPMPRKPCAPAVPRAGEPFDLSHRLLFHVHQAQRNPSSGSVPPSRRSPSPKSLPASSSWFGSTRFPIRSTALVKRPPSCVEWEAWRPSIPLHTRDRFVNFQLTLAHRPAACPACGGSLWFQHRCSAASGQTARRAPHWPRSPSAITGRGQAIPCSRRSRGTPPQIPVDSRCPGVTGITTFRRFLD